MKRAYSVSSYAKLYEKYCKENLPSEADDIFKKADEYYREFMRRDMPDLGKNMMATNMYDWFTIVSFYEASGHRLDGEVLLTIKRDAAEKMKFLGKIVNGNKSNWPYKLFEKTYVKFNRMQKEHLVLRSRRCSQRLCVTFWLWISSWLKKRKNTKT